MYARVARSALPDRPPRSVPEVSAAEGFLHGAWLADRDAGELVVLVLLETDAPRVPLPGDVERWSVLSFAGRVGGAWCLAHRLDGEALPSVLQSAVDRAVASQGCVGAVGLVDDAQAHGVVYAFCEERPAEGHGGRLYRVLATS